MDLYFYGYYPKALIDSIPQTSGIYLAFAGRATSCGTFEPDRLVYIGKGGDNTSTIHSRVLAHMNGTDSTDQNEAVWKAKLKKGNKSENDVVFAYSFAELPDNPDLLDIETALIYANEANGIYNVRDTGAEVSESACALDVSCHGKKGNIRNHQKESSEHRRILKLPYGDK